VGEVEVALALAAAAATSSLQRDNCRQVATIGTTGPPFVHTSPAYKPVAHLLFYYGSGYLNDLH